MKVRGWCGLDHGGCHPLRFGYKYSNNVTKTACVSDPLRLNNLGQLCMWLLSRSNRPKNMYCVCFIEGEHHLSTVMGPVQIAGTLIANASGCCLMIHP